MSSLAIFSKKTRSTPIHDFEISATTALTSNVEETSNCFDNFSTFSDVLEEHIIPPKAPKLRP